MRSSHYAGIREQVIIVDACANSWNLKEGDVPHEQPAVGEPIELRQLAMFAASLGEFAENKGIEQAGLFSHEVLKQINSLPPGTWPPDMKVIMNNVQQEFVELRVKGQFRQTPVYALYVVNGNEEYFAQVKPKSEVDEVQPSSIVLKRFQDLTSTEAEELRTPFLACPSIKDSATRRAIVQQLRYVIANEFNKGGEARDLMDLIKICFSHQNGVGELLHFMNLYERNSDEIEALKQTVARITDQKVTKQLELDLSELLFDQVDKLAKTLIDCPALTNEFSRDEIIDALERETTIRKGSIRHGAGLEPLQIVKDILKKCQSHKNSFNVFIRRLCQDDGSTVEFGKVEELIKDLLAQNK